MLIIPDSIFNLPLLAAIRGAYGSVYRRWYLDASKGVHLKVILISGAILEAVNKGLDVFSLVVSQYLTMGW